MMSTIQRVAVVFTVVNVVVLVAVMTRDNSVLAQGEAEILLGRGLELVDAAGRVGASISVGPEGGAILQMRDGEGTIRVKLGAGADGSGLLLLDQTTEPGVQMRHRRARAATRRVCCRWQPPHR